MFALDHPLPGILLKTRDGQHTLLQDHLGERPTVVLAMRYYGCLPCQHYLLALHERRDQFAGRGVDVVVVGVAAGFQADHLASTYGIEFPLLLDPDQNLYRALDIPRLRTVDFLRWRTWTTYLPLFWRRYVTRTVDGPKQGRIVGDPAQLPGIAFIENGVVRWIHRGLALGDYPPVDELLTRLDEVLPAA